MRKCLVGRHVVYTGYSCIVGNMWYVRWPCSTSLNVKVRWFQSVETVNGSCSMTPTGSFIWVLDAGGMGFMGREYTMHTNLTWIGVYGIPPSPNIQHPNNTACDDTWSQ